MVQRNKGVKEDEGAKEGCRVARAEGTQKQPAGTKQKARKMGQGTECKGTGRQQVSKGREGE